MTEYAPASGRDRDTYFSNPHLLTPHYTNGNGVNYFYPQGQLQLPATGTYTSCNTMYTAASPQANSQSPICMSNHNPAGVPYSLAPPPRPYPAQPRTLSYPPYHTGLVPTQRIGGAHQLRRGYNPDLALSHINEIESQESINEDIMLSEPLVPALEGYPDVAEFDRLMDSYVGGLSPKKRDKALINARRARNIRTVLLDKKTTAVESAQFRFWVKKMFCLKQVGNGPRSICHELKPVAVREKLFKILTRAHKACHHGGRDKTSAQVRRVYSWVPKELISRFVKMCPTCKIRRPSRDESTNNIPETPPSDEDMPDSPDVRRASTTEVKRESISVQPPMGFSSAFAQQNRWMADLPNDKTKTKNEYYESAMPVSYSGHDSPAAMSPQYSNRLSEQFNALSFPSTEMSAPSGFPSSNVRSTGNWQSVNTAYGSGYSNKQEHGVRVKKEHRY